MSNPTLVFKVDKRVCKACGICAALCPRQALELGEDGKPFMAHEDRCIVCQLCELRCPDMALRIGRAKQ